MSTVNITPSFLEKDLRLNKTIHVLSTHNSRPLYFTVRNQSPSFVVFSPLGVPVTLERGRQIYLHEKVEGIICLFHSVDTSVMVEK